MSLEELFKYVGVTLGIASLFFLPTLWIRKSYFKKRHIVYTWKRELAEICFIFYMLCLFQITAFRFGGIGWDMNNMLDRWTRVNFMPFFDTWRWLVYGSWWHLFYNIVGNCLWFIPFGFMLPAIYSEYRKYGWLVIFMGMSVSMLIEVLQFIFCTGVTDIDDIIFNTIGTIIGYILWRIVDALRKK